MKNWVALGLLCFASAAYATDKTTPAKTPPPSTEKPSAKAEEAANSKEPKVLTVEEDKAAKQDPKNKKTETKAKEGGSKPTM
ncbi:hypothetical protein MYSTI_07674 [Myxococcus stipitatus DSM 14675]|uniref:Lipoprotein n=1 Tax=Myxococcus stipitatus (strain DSM 14675 / JCM 12634 / Mx s8) TaxID=1278073 RepID=L7UJ05_MYXSD|nr:hypothetical protein [Myxococcus stipitatus]AGC48946.1 hypothetical protein MYSTI_07674 [Myxococcus stipitatus DSM 14675]